VSVAHVHDTNLETYELRCEKCGKTRRVARGEHEAIGSHDISMGRRPQLPRR
jgi:hypothetical protein